MPRRAARSTSCSRTATTSTCGSPKRSCSAAISAYLGLIGSKTKRARFRHRFEQRGIDTETLDRMTCPIGVPGIVGKAPEVIAIAVVAQLLQRAEGSLGR